MRCLGDVLTKTLPYDVVGDVLKKPKHRAYDVFMTIFVPQWNQEVQVHTMQQAFQSKYRCEDPLLSSHWGETTDVYTLQLPSQSRC